MVRRVTLATVVLGMFAVLGSGCIDRFSGTTVSLYLAPQVKVNKTGEHYELYVTMHDAAIPVRKLVAKIVDKNGFREPQVQDFYTGQKLGVLSHLGQSLQQEFGVEFSTAYKLKDVTEVFIAIKKDTDTSPLPGDNIFLFGKVYSRDSGVIRARLRPLDNQDVNTPAWAAIALIVAEDQKQF